MAEFRKVDPLMLTVSDSTGDYNVYPTVEDELLDFGEFGLNMKSAVALRDWLNKALPCEHRIILNGFKRVDPFGKSDAIVEVKNECQECGVIVPASAQASGGEKHG